MATSARLPATSDPISLVEPERPRPAERRELQRRGCGDRIRRARRARVRARSPSAAPRRSRATAPTRRRPCRRRRAALRPGAPAAVRSRSRAARSSADNARPRRRGGRAARSPPRRPSRSARRRSLVEQACAARAAGCRSGRPARSASRPTAARALRRGAASRARRSLSFRVSRDRQVELSAGGVDLRRAGVRRVRRHTERDALRECAVLHVLAVVLESRSASSASVPNTSR